MAEEKYTVLTGLQLNTQGLTSTNDNMNWIKAVFMKETYAINIKLYHKGDVGGHKDID